MKKKYTNHLFSRKENENNYNYYYLFQSNDILVVTKLWNIEKQSVINLITAQTETSLISYTYVQ